MAPNKKIFLISIIFTAFLLILICFVIYPLFKEIKKSSENLIVVRKELTLSRDLSGNIGQIKKLYGEIEPDFKKIEGFFIDSEAPIDLIKFWEETASDLKILINITPISMGIKEADPWNSIGFQMNLVSSFSNFVRFLEKIENSPYLIEVLNLNIRSLDESELKSPKYIQFSAGDINANLVVKVFAK